ncbi:glycosyltransferase family 39 protein [Nitratireductor indicus]|nr:glycosyltransferase family 39 protein [Nitratireductor indicus]SFQ52277.1 Dolichyl-phosphate-mannose-protein mannosyltransferase [Nitratireductor indicus]
MKNRLVNFQYAIIFIFSIFLYSIFFVGFYGSDDLQYASGIRFFAGLNGGEITNIGSLRFPLVLPGAVFAKLGGAVQWAFVSQLLYFLILSFIIYFIIKKNTNVNISTAGAMSCISIPAVSIFSPSLLPDSIISIFILIHALTFEKSINNKFHIFLSGIVLGFIYSSKEASMLYIIPWWIYFLIYFSRNGWVEFFLKGSLYASGFTLIFLTDALIQFYATGAVLPRLYGGLDAAQNARAFMERQGYLPIDRLRFALSQLNKGYSFIFLMIIPPILAASTLRKRPVNFQDIRFEIILYSAGIWIFLYNTFGTISFSEYIGVPIQTRYYIPSYIFLLISTIILLSKTFTGSIANTSISISLICLTSMHLFSAIPVAGQIYGASNYRLTAAAVEKAKGIDMSPIFFSKDIFARTRYGTMEAVKQWPGNEHFPSDCRYWLLSSDANEISRIKGDQPDAEIAVYPVTSPRSRVAFITQMYGLGPIFPEKVSNLQLMHVNKCKETNSDQERL